MTEALIASISKLKYSATVADPSLDDCPLIGCCDTFEAITGYQRSEVTGKNCRFLSHGVDHDPVLRGRLREAVKSQREFMGILPNVRRDGEKFDNFLHLSALDVRGRRYLIGVQADVTDLDLRLDSVDHLGALITSVKEFLANNIGAWVQMQVKEFAMRLPIPCSEILKLCAPDAFQQLKDSFIRLGSGDQTLPKRENVHSAWGGAYLIKDQSLGSDSRPNNCVECYFYFCHPNGCRLGENCTFCHELQPHTNPNRHLLRELMSGLATTDLAPIAVNNRCSQQSISSLSTSAGTFASLQNTELKVMESKVPKTHGGMEGMVAEELSSAGFDEENVPDYGNLVQLRYTNYELVGAQTPVLLIAGVNIHFPAQMNMGSLDQKLLKGRLTFRADPALPKDLTLDSNSGLISGQPSEVQTSPSLHHIICSAGTPSTAGSSLGRQVLASCFLSIRVVGLHNYMLYSAQDDKEDSDRLILDLRAS